MLTLLPALDLSVSDRSTGRASSSDESETSTIRTRTLAEPSTALTVPTVDPVGTQVIETEKKHRKYSRRKLKGLDTIADKKTRIEQEVGHAAGGAGPCPPGDYSASLELDDKDESAVRHLAIENSPLAGRTEAILLASTTVIFFAILFNEKACSKVLLIPSIAFLVMLGRVLSTHAANNLSALPDAPLHCVTQGHGSDGAFRAQIGLPGHQVPRWAAGTKLRYVICAETFPHPEDAALAASNLAQAIDQFADVPVTFEEVTRNTKAHFRVVYKDPVCADEANVLASAFFPNRGPRNTRTLHIYALAFRKRHIGSQVQVLAHEVGHILGLRHEFAPESAECRSFTYGRRNPDSIMSYPADWSTAKVTQQDIDELRGLYLDTRLFLQDDAGDDWHFQTITPRPFLYPYENTRRNWGFMAAFWSFRRFQRHQQGNATAR